MTQKSFIWINNYDSDLILYKEEQEEHYFINKTSVEWKISTESETSTEIELWNYSYNFNKLYIRDEEGYILKKGESISILESKKNSFYYLKENNVIKGSIASILIYPITYHKISDNGNITIDSIEERQCILFKSGSYKNSELRKELNKKLNILKNYISEKTLIKIDLLVEKISKEKAKNIYEQIEEIETKLSEKYKYIVKYLKLKLELKMLEN